MRVVPEHVTKIWMDSLADDDLIAVEARLHTTFATLERRDRKKLGDAYGLLRGSPDLLTAWDKWSRLNNAARGRGLRVVRPK